MNEIEIIVETPGGYSLKYNYDFDFGFLKVKKKLPAVMVFPFDFGCIPGTKGEDGDPLDVLLISECNAIPGCRVQCRIIGSIQARQSKEESSFADTRNDRLLAIPAYSVQFERVYEIHELPEAIISQIESFFKNYNAIEGKEFVVIRRVDANAAYEFLEQSKLSKS